MCRIECLFGKEIDELFQNSREDALDINYQVTFKKLPNSIREYASMIIDYMADGPITDEIFAMLYSELKADPKWEATRKWIATAINSNKPDLFAEKTLDEIQEFIGEGKKEPKPVKPKTNSAKKRRRRQKKRKQEEAAEAAE
jgi:hypothetical protein